MEITQEQQLFTKIIQEAWSNDAFKAELLLNPQAAIEKLTGKKLNLPEGKTCVVRDQTDDSVIYINIPPVENTDFELNDEQLEAVAGGIFDPFGNGGGCTPTLPFPIKWPPPFVQMIN